MAKTVKLGQLFLLRRDLKNEISSITSDMLPLVAYREDRDSTENEYLSLRADLLDARTKLHLYDRLIEQENAKTGTVRFEEHMFSLNEARHYKVHLLATMAFVECLLRQALLYNKRTEKESYQEQADPTNPTSPVIVKQVERKFVIVPDIKLLKVQIKDLKRNVQVLDSLIQGLDWLITVEIPD